MLVALISVVVMTLTKRALIQQQVNAGRYVIGGFQAALSTLADPRDPQRALSEQFPRLLSAFEDPQQSPPIYGALILDRDFDVLAHSRGALVGAALLDDDLLRAAIRGLPVYQVSASGGPLGLGGGLEIRFSAPLYPPRERGRQQAPIAYLRFTLRDEQTLPGFRILTRGLLAYEALTALILVLMVSLLLLRTVGRPLEQLLRATQRLSDGDYSARVPNPPANELGQLAEEFNRLAERLETNREALSRRMDELQRAQAELSTARDELILQDRLAYIGRVAAGVAHEIGNPLSAAIGYLEILRLGADSGEPLPQTLSRVERELQRIDTIVRGLLDFARPSSGDALPSDPGAIVRSSVELLRTQRALDQVQVGLEIAPDLPELAIDQTQLRQVLVNLIINAADAMPLGGRIEIECSSGGFDPLEASLPRLVPERRDQPDGAALHGRPGLTFSGPVRLGRGEACVTIRVRDHGEGMDQPRLERIFEPFFSTKRPGRGTGLGLAICQRLVESAGGFIAVESRPGQGSLFTICLPARPGGAGAETR